MKKKKYISNERKTLFEKVTVSSEPALGLKKLHFCYLLHRKFVVLMVILKGFSVSVVSMVTSITENESKYSD